VNFNAGVVGAGEAVIESTVTGNEPKVDIADEASFLKNQQQVREARTAPLGVLLGVGSVSTQRSVRRGNERLQI